MAQHAPHNSENTKQFLETAVKCVKGVTLQVTLRCHLSVQLSIHGRTPCVELTTPLPPCQLNTAELKRLHLVCDGSMDSELICDGRVIEWEIRIAMLRSISSLTIEMFCNCKIWGKAGGDYTDKSISLDTSPHFIPYLFVLDARCILFDWTCLSFASKMTYFCKIAIGKWLGRQLWEM